MEDIPCGIRIFIRKGPGAVRADDFCQRGYVLDFRKTEGVGIVAMNAEQASSNATPLAAMNMSVNLVNHQPGKIAD